MLGLIKDIPVYNNSTFGVIFSVINDRFFL